MPSTQPTDTQETDTFREKEIKLGDAHQANVSFISRHEPSLRKEPTQISNKGIEDSLRDKWPARPGSPIRLSYPGQYIDRNTAQKRQREVPTLLNTTHAAGSSRAYKAKVRTTRTPPCIQPTFQFRFSRQYNFLDTQVQQEIADSIWKRRNEQWLDWLRAAPSMRDDSSNARITSEELRLLTTYENNLSVTSEIVRTSR